MTNKKECWVVILYEAPKRPNYGYYAAQTPAKVVGPFSSQEEVYHYANSLPNSSFHDVWYVDLPLNKAIDS